jgi:hypothetical protein
VLSFFLLFLSIPLFMHFSLPYLHSFCILFLFFSSLLLTLSVFFLTLLLSFRFFSFPHCFNTVFWLVHMTRSEHRCTVNG